MDILITSGGTSEKIDNVRKITNSSTGKLGCKIAETFASIREIDKIWYICGKSAPIPQNTKLESIVIESTDDLLKVIMNICGRNHIDVVVHAMAVSDYYVKTVSTIDWILDSIATHLSQMDKEAIRLNNKHYISLKEKLIGVIQSVPSLDNYTKISSDMENLVLFLEKTPKILPYFRGMLPYATIVGFKLLDSVDREFLINKAYQLLIQNDCDYVLANDQAEIDVKHVGHLVGRNKAYITYSTKTEIAEGIAKIALEHRHMMKETFAGVDTNNI